ncbi:MAG: ABC transporter substrate-binding protein, partial [Proteobacteria bacterium]
EYDQLFKQVMVNNYVRLLGSHSGQKFEVKRCDIRQGKAIVSSQLIQFPGSMPLGIQWVLRWTGGGFRIIDVNIQGISMATSQRSEFTSILAQNNGSIEALLKVLRQRVAPTPSINQS